MPMERKHSAVQLTIVSPPKTGFQIRIKENITPKIPRNSKLDQSENPMCFISYA